MTAEKVFSYLWLGMAIFWFISGNTTNGLVSIAISEIFDSRHKMRDK